MTSQTAPTASERPPSPTLRRLSLSLLALVAGAAFERLAVTTALPSAVGELDGVALYGWLFTAFMLTNVIGLAVSGPLFDRFGISRPLLSGVAVFSSGLLASALAPTMHLLIAGRALQGLGAGVLSVATYTAIARGYSDTARPRMLALNASAFTVPSLIGPLIAGLLADSAGWRWVFWILVPLLPVAALLARAPLADVDKKHATGRPTAALEAS